MTETGPGSSYLGTATDEDRERARAGALRDYDVLESERHPELDSLAELAARACGCPWSSIALVDHELLYPVSVYGYSAPVQSRGGRMSAAILAVLGDSVMMIPDAQQDPRFSDNPYVTGELMSFRMIATAPLRTPAGHSIGIVSVSHPEARELDDDTVRLLRTVARQIVDTLELRRRSRISQEIINELSRSQQQLAHFASQVSHDLKTPLTATIGFAEMLQDMPSVAADPNASAYVDRIASSGNRMLTLVQDVLAYARLGGTLRREEVQLRDLLSAVIEDLGDLAGQAAIRSDDVTLVGDPAQLRVLLQNLVTNAITYRRPEVEPVVVVTAGRTDRGVELRVADNGRGIPADKRAIVFQPFQRLESEIPGSGLGLATCERIVTAHRGHISIADTPGGGTTFLVDLPS